MVAVLNHVIHKQSFVDPTEVGAQDIELLVGLSVCLYVCVFKKVPATVALIFVCALANVWKMWKGSFCSLGRL